MRFKGRDLLPYLETVQPGDLIEGQEYFSISYVDHEMHLPIFNSLVYIGMNLEYGEQNKYYFQDLDSYAIGTRYETASPEIKATFHTGDIIKSIQNFEQALNELLRCSLRRESKRK